MTLIFLLLKKIFWYFGYSIVQQPSWYHCGCSEIVDYINEDEHDKICEG
jgi:hypothetical protein